MSSYSNYSKNIGSLGEIFVAKFLIQRGFLIYETNMKKIDAELDIVMYKVYPTYIDIRLVEVKTRSEQVFDREGLGRFQGEEVEKSDFCTLESYKLKTKIKRYARYSGQIATDISNFLKSTNNHDYGIDSTKNVFCKISIDLAVVSFDRRGVVNPYRLCKYYQNVNLLI